jgi:uncharacterized cupredoxin-like copper-binding protein
MRGRRTTVAALGAAAVLSAAATLLPAGAAARPLGVASPTRVPARIQVTEKEFTLTLSRQRVPAGPVIVEVVDFGMDSHDLIVQGNVKGSKQVHFAQLAPGAHESKTLTLKRGKYTLWCSLPGHRKLGMVAPLTVT